MRLLSFLFILLPLIAGFFYCEKSQQTKYKFSKLDGKRLYYTAALHGAIIASLSLAFLIVAISVAGYWAIEICTNKIYDNYKHWVVNHHIEISVIYLFIFLPLTTWLLLFFSNRKIDENTLETLRLETASHFETLLEKAIRDIKPICFNLDNKQFYIGLPIAKESTYIEDSIGREFITILPYFSGYRNDENDLVFKTKYDYDKLLKEYSELTREDFYKVLAIDNIISANIFDIPTYLIGFNKKKK